MNWGGTMIELNYDEKSLEAVVDTISPAIKIKLNVKLDYNEIPLKPLLELYSAEGKLLAKFAEFYQPLNANPEALKQVPSLPRTDTLNRKETHHTYLMQAFLDKASLDHIEEARDRNKKRDVVLLFRASVEYLSVNIEIGNFKVSRTAIGGASIAIIPSAPREEPDSSLRILRSSDELSNTLVSLNKIVREFVITVSSSDWVNEFQEPLGIGRFMVIEVPTINTELEALSDAQNELKVLLERINKAKEILDDMNKNMRDGEWSRVIEDSRKFLELFTKDVKGTIKDLIEASTGVSDEDATKLTTAFDNLYGYASSLHHPFRKNGSTPATPAKVFTGGKEDAYLSFNLCASILNLVSRKLYDRMRALPSEKQDIENGEPNK